MLLVTTTIIIDDTDNTNDNKQNDNYAEDLLPVRPGWTSSSYMMIPYGMLPNVKLTMSSVESCRMIFSKPWDCSVTNR